MTTHEISEGPWELIVGNENHGPYVVDRINRDVCDCYAMSSPAVASVQNGGTSKPVPFANAEANARLIAAAPELLDLARNVGGFDDSLLLSADLNMIRATLLEFRTHARAAIARAEQST